MGKYCSQL